MKKNFWKKKNFKLRKQIDYAKRNLILFEQS